MADKLFSDVQDRTTAMRENQQNGNSGEIVVDNHKNPPPALQRAAANTNPIIISSPAPKPVCVHPAIHPPNGRSVEAGSVREKVRSFQDSTDSVPISVQIHPVNPSGLGKEKTDARPTPPAHVPSKEEKDRRMKDMTKLHREMAQKAEKTKHRNLKTAIGAISGIASDVLLHSRKSEPPPKLPEPNDAPHVMPIQLRSRGLPSLPKESPDAAEYDVAYSQPRDNEYSEPLQLRDNEYSEPYTEIPQGSVMEQPNDSDSYTYAAVAPTGRMDVKMSAVAADMSRSRHPIPVSQLNSDTYSYLDFVGAPGDVTKDNPKSSGHIYGHLSVAETEDEAGYADPVFLNEPPTQKGSKK